MKYVRFDWARARCRDAFSHASENAKDALEIKEDYFFKRKKCSGAIFNFQKHLRVC